MSFNDSRTGAGLAGVLLDMVLPFITTLILHPGAEYYVKPPQANWRETLKGCNHYLSRAREWDDWIEYNENIREFLIYRSILATGDNFLNIRFKDKLTALFTDEEISMFREIISSWEHARNSTGQLFLTPEKGRILSRAQNAVGELMIASEVHRWRLESIPVPTMA